MAISIRWVDIESHVKMDDLGFVKVAVRDDDFRHVQVNFRFENLEGGLPLREVLVMGEESRPETFPPPISSRELGTEFPWRAWEKAARTAAAERVWEEDGNHVEGDEPTPTDPHKTLLAQVASEYRANVKAGLRNPAGLIAQRHGVSPGTVRSWIHRGRKLGLLGPAADRAAGEIAAPAQVRGLDQNTDGRSQT